MCVCLSVYSSYRKSTHQKRVTFPCHLHHSKSRLLLARSARPLAIDPFPPRDKIVHTHNTPQTHGENIHTRTLARSLAFLPLTKMGSKNGQGSGVSCSCYFMFLYEVISFCSCSYVIVYVIIYYILSICIYLPCLTVPLGFIPCIMNRYLVYLDEIAQKSILLCPRFSFGATDEPLPLATYKDCHYPAISITNQYQSFHSRSFTVHQVCVYLNLPSL